MECRKYDYVSQELSQTSNPVRWSLYMQPVRSERKDNNPPQWDTQEPCEFLSGIRYQCIIVNSMLKLRE